MFQWLSEISTIEANVQVDKQHYSGPELHRVLLTASTPTQTTKRTEAWVEHRGLDKKVLSSMLRWAEVRSTVKYVPMGQDQKHL